MEIIEINGLRKLIPSDNTLYLMSVEDLKKDILERYYFKFAFLPPAATIEECEEKYIETKKETEEDVYNG